MIAEKRRKNPSEKRENFCSFFSYSSSRFLLLVHFEHKIFLLLENSCSGNLGFIKHVFCLLCGAFFRQFHQRERKYG